MGEYRWAVIGMGVLATILIALGIGVFYGYVPSNWVDNLTDTELGFLGVLAIIGAVGLEILDRRR